MMFMFPHCVFEIKFSDKNIYECLSEDSNILSTRDFLQNFE